MTLVDFFWIILLPLMVGLTAAVLIEVSKKHRQKMQDLRDQLFQIELEMDSLRRHLATPSVHIQGGTFTGGGITITPPGPYPYWCNDCSANDATVHPRMLPAGATTFLCDPCWSNYVGVSDEEFEEYRKKLLP